MSGIPEIIGIVVGVAPVIFKATVETWKAVDDAIDFDDDAEDLIIRLERTKAHLGIWAAKAGLTAGELVDSLHPFDELIVRILERIRDLFAEVEQQGQKYGLVPKDSKDSKTITATVIQMRKSLHSIMSNSSTKSSIVRLVEKRAAVQTASVRVDVAVRKRASWAVRDKKRFAHFIEMLEQHVHGLRKFTIEKSQKQIQQDEARLAMDIIRGLTDPAALLQLQRASGLDSASSQIGLHVLAKWKAITVQRAVSANTDPDTRDWSLARSTMEDRARIRFLKESSTDPDVAYLFEKKEYDLNIEDDSKDHLRERIYQLLSLLGGNGGRSHLHTLKTVGYLDDPDYHCWWIVFRFPLSPIDHLEPHSNEPMSLRALYVSPFKPPLEERYRLAKRLVDTFAKLYGSSWMHKGINSKNIIFPQLYSASVSKSFTSIQTALIQGFNYSRQLSQAQTIDRGKVLHDLESAIYRHPNYQGEAATGYQIHYDIYSLGLVLLEIALWGPIMDLLAAKIRPGTDSVVTLAPTMSHFHEAEALELKRRVMIRINGDVAYRVGTRYKEMVRWCLTLDGPVTAIEFYNTVAIPLDELCGQY
ncbi:hypothetical protein P280DRAFT_469011 [Massarina eburnea CBS 473.64]|uniref:Prion-inhibition and propagation HeLo domain-containing protein n=1 Tax=Massarina eburnea CBS 473.64 TaxID=1395130 RepID=A0A6A6S5F4_9PLEO|nr:hypothetical protein P280DRAFT_469011 [Massarina eburnea CBS 473.64]